MESINEILQQYPIALDIDDNDVIETALDLLPYSTGFEIECNPKDNIKINDYISLGLFYSPDVGGDE